MVAAVRCAAGDGDEQKSGSLRSRSSRLDRRRKMEASGAPNVGAHDTPLIAATRHGSAPGVAPAVSTASIIQSSWYRQCSASASSASGLPPGGTQVTSTAAAPSAMRGRRRTVGASTISIEVESADGADHSE